MGLSPDGTCQRAGRKRGRAGGGVGTTIVPCHPRPGLSPLPMWSWGAQMFLLASILIVASMRSSSWVSLGGGLVHRGCRYLQMIHWCSWTMHWLPPQPKSWPRRPASEAHDAWCLQCAWMGGVTLGHPEESPNREQGSAGPGARVPWAHVLQCVMWCNACLRSGLHVFPRWRANVLAEPTGSV